MAVVVEAMKVVYNWLYLTALVGFLICKHEGSGSFLPNITRPERGSGLRISCSLSADSGQVALYSDTLNSVLTQCRLDLERCIPSFYGDWQNPVYTFGDANGAVWVDILSLNRTRDEGFWHCYESGNRQNNETLVLTVYGSPGGVSLVTPLPPVVDLAEISIMLQCKTDSCEYPEPSITWYYQKGPNPISLNTGMIRRSNSTENCIQQEQIHYSSLELSRGTNFPGNIPMTVNLLCGITHPSLNGTKFSAISNNVIFAVSLIFVNISGKIDVIQGVQANFICITSISRPRASVTWFIGTTEITSGIQTINSTDVNGSPFVESMLTINPNSLIHHGKEIFCQAFTPSDRKTSEKLVLYVKVITPDSSSTFSLPAVAGGIGAGVVVILMAVVALFLWRRCHHRSQHTDGTQRNQINAKSVRHDAASGQDYEGYHINNTEASAYLQLNDITLEENRYANTRPPENDSYEKLHPYTNSDIQMYSSLKIPKISKDSEKVYENTQIKASDLNC